MRTHEFEAVQWVAGVKRRGDSASRTFAVRARLRTTDLSRPSGESIAGDASLRPGAHERRLALVQQD